MATLAVRPMMRGRLHEWAFFMSIPMGVALVATSAGARPKVAAIVYALSLAALFGTSATYHRVRWQPRARRVWRRLDHSMIFVLIAGTYTPFCLLAMRGATAWALLATAWLGAGAGIALALVDHDRAQALKSTLYVVLGWVVVIALPQLIGTMEPSGVILLAAGGVLYTVGAICFARKRPDPSPAVFGYHEVWHSFVLGAGLCHYGAVFGIVAR